MAKKRKQEDVRDVLMDKLTLEELDGLTGEQIIAREEGREWRE